jgi:HlyD family secretion protein
MADRLSAAFMTAPVIMPPVSSTSRVMKIGMTSKSMSVTDMSLITSEVKVDETDIGVVQLGQPVRITVDAFRNRTFDGKVVRIAPMGVEKDNVTRFEVRVSILNDIEILKVSMTANAEILLEEHQNVLLIPESALIYNEKRETFVEVPDRVTPTGRRQTAVKIGLSNGARAEVLELLDA